MDIAEELRERTALRYSGNCKCGKCQLVPREIVDAAGREIARLRSDFAALQHALVGESGLSAIMEAERLRRLHPLQQS